MTKPICPRCKSSDTSLCSHGGWNCPNCFNFIRKATPEEKQKQKEAFKEIMKREPNENEGVIL